MLRRGLSLGIALALAAMASLPMLACDLPMARMECHLRGGKEAASAAQHCETDTTPAHSAPVPARADDDADSSCCVLAPVPLPPAPGKTDAPAPTATSDHVVMEDTVGAPVAAPRAIELSSPIVVAPDRQPVLCTFLI